jgi:hypothetical protein
MQITPCFAVQLYTALKTDRIAAVEGQLLEPFNAVGCCAPAACSKRPAAAAAAAAFLLGAACTAAAMRQLNLSRCYGSIHTQLVLEPVNLLCLPVCQRQRPQLCD